MVQFFLRRHRDMEAAYLATMINFGEVAGKAVSLCGILSVNLEKTGHYRSVAG
jgi:hypothetical protein